MERGTWRTLIGFVIALTLWRPAAAPGQPAGAAHEVPAAITYSADVAPLVHRSCVPCHRPDGPAPFSLTTYEDVRRRASQIAAVTKSGVMPPWKPDAGSGPFVGERRLTDGEIDRLARRAAGGAPLGDPGAVPVAPVWPSGWQLGQPDLVLTLPEYELRADGRDVFRNFVLPASTGGPRYVRGFEFRADSAAVHHANIRVDYTPASRALEEADPDPGYEGLVLRSADYSDGHFLGWPPGQWPPLAPEGLAWTLQEGADFVVQLHMRPTGKRERIRPRFGLFFTDTPPARTPAMLRLGRQNIDIPAGNSSHRSLDE